MRGIGHWTFLSNHSHVLLCLAKEPCLTIRVIAQQVGITERSVQKIIVDLEQAEVLIRERVGRNNHYRVDLNKSLRHPLEAHCTLSQLMEVLGANLPEDTSSPGSTSSPENSTATEPLLALRRKSVEAKPSIVFNRAHKGL